MKTQRTNIFPLLIVVSLLVLMRIARAEFTVGSDLPAVSLPATDGARVELAVADGSLMLRHDAEQQKPAAVVIHLLQPDCLQCRAQLAELAALSKRFQPRGVAVLGISHRGEMTDLQQLGKDLAITFPLLHGTDSEIAKQFAAGDTLGIADKGGVVRYGQVGFGKGDEELWAAALEELLAGRTVSKTTVDRERLAVGDRFPAVELPSIQSGRSMALVGKNGRLTFRDEEGKETQPKGAIGFFSRY